MNLLIVAVVVLVTLPFVTTAVVVVETVNLEEEN